MPSGAGEGAEAECLALRRSFRPHVAAMVSDQIHHPKMPRSQTFESGSQAMVIPSVPTAPPVAKIRPSQPSQRGKSPVRRAAIEVAAMTVAIAAMPRSANRCEKFWRRYQPRRVASSTVVSLRVVECLNQRCRCDGDHEPVPHRDQHSATDNEVCKG